MRFSTIAQEAGRLVRLASEIRSLPRAQLQFDTELNRDHIRATHKIFTKRHPRYYLIKNKTVGIALLDLREFKTAEDYLDRVNKKDYAGYHAKRARVRGYSVKEIDRNRMIDEIHDINVSTENRQGRPMDQAYQIKQTHFDDYSHVGYFGVVDKNGKLVGYCNIVTLGNFAATEKLIGYKTNDGFMFLLLTEIICQLIEKKTVSYLMYDSYLGAQPGLRNFKHRLGFRPYLIRYSIA